MTAQATDAFNKEVLECGRALEAFPTTAEAFPETNPIGLDCDQMELHQVCGFILKAVRDEFDDPTHSRLFCAAAAAPDSAPVIYEEVILPVHGSFLLATSPHGSLLYSYQVHSGFIDSLLCQSSANSA